MDVVEPHPQPQECLLSLVYLVQPGQVADNVSQAASEASGQASGVADQAKGNLGSAIGNQDNPISGRTADTIDKVLAQHSQWKASKLLVTAHKPRRQRCVTNQTERAFA